MKILVIIKANVQDKDFVFVIHFTMEIIANFVKKYYFDL